MVSLFSNAGKLVCVRKAGGMYGEGLRPVNWRVVSDAHVSVVLNVYLCATDAVSIIYLSSTGAAPTAISSEGSAYNSQRKFLNSSAVSPERQVGLSSVVPSVDCTHRRNPNISPKIEESLVSIVRYTLNKVFSI